MSYLGMNYRDQVELTACAGYLCLRAMRFRSDKPSPTWDEMNSTFRYVYIQDADDLRAKGDTAKIKIRGRCIERGMNDVEIPVYLEALTTMTKLFQAAE